MGGLAVLAPSVQPFDVLVRVLPAHGGPANAVAISPDGTWLATSSDRVRIWAALRNPPG
ncbi:MAG: WD40 repeat domain-containing protein [Streptosporangiaceae bacterium]